MSKQRASFLAYLLRIDQPPEGRGDTQPAPAPQSRTGEAIEGVLGHRSITSRGGLYGFGAEPVQGFLARVNLDEGSRHRPGERLSGAGMGGADHHATMTIAYANPTSTPIARRV
jgi:hypothetical protein